MHHLGSAEWEDAEAAIEYAVAHGARRLVLVGWSMGGGIVLRTSVRSAHRDLIAALVLDSPAVDWQDILVYHATALKAPAPMRRLALWMMTSRIGARMVRLHEPLALDEMTPATTAAPAPPHPALPRPGRHDRAPGAECAHLAALRPDLIAVRALRGRLPHPRVEPRSRAATSACSPTILVDLLDLDVDVESMELPVRDPAAAPLEGSIGTRV
jgi:pimeloyl-ACP methyl ester carboxylesterase